MIAAQLSLLAFAFYLAAVVSYGAVFFLRSPAAPSSQAIGAPLIPRLGRPFLLLGILAQFAAIGAWCVTMHRSPFASQFGTLSVAAWAIAISMAALDFRARLPSVGAVALLVACLLLFLGVLRYNAPVAETTLLAGRLVTMHVIAILASFGLFAVAFGSAALYLLQNRLLKEHKVSALLRRLPPLETLDTMAYHAVAYALPLLTAGLTLGFARVYGGGLSLPIREWFLDPHTIVSLVTWFLYVLYIGARLAVGWRGVRLQYILLAGFLIVLALYVMPSSTHRFR